jgi:hypothetical protein
LGIIEARFGLTRWTLAIFAIDPGPHVNESLFEFAAYPIYTIDSGMQGTETSATEGVQHGVSRLDPPASQSVFVDAAYQAA